MLAITGNIPRQWRFALTGDTARIWLSKVAQTVFCLGWGPLSNHCNVGLAGRYVPSTGDGASPSRIECSGWLLLAGLLAMMNLVLG